MLLLVDASSYLYRAYHALPDLRNAAGEPTGALYGVINMLRRLQADHKADYLACVFDARGRTFRDDLYPQYKAQRAAMPDDLSRQVEPLLETIRALGWPLLQEEGVEADDVIGTLARAAEAKGIRTIISTGDKDLAQLVTPAITLVNTMSNERFDEAAVEKKFGVPPSQFLDYLALVGDAVDNVPGVPKVGPKTAAKWLHQYGSLETIVAHADDIGGAVGENLRASLEWLPKAKRLLTVKCDLELPVAPEDLKPRPRDEAKLVALFTRFNLKSWLKEVTSATALEAPEETPAPKSAGVARARRYETLLTIEALRHWAGRLSAAPLVSLDTETSSLDPMTARLVGLSFCIEAGEATYIPLAHDYAGAPAQISAAQALSALKPWLEDRLAAKLGQNMKYDQHLFANHGVQLRGVMHDTLLESYVLESSARHDMESLAERWLGEKIISYDDLTGKGAQRIAFNQVEIGRAAEYAAQDADITLRLHQTLQPRIEADEKLAFVYGKIEMPVREVLFRMERAGVLIDVPKLEAMSREFGRKMMELEARAHLEAGAPFNLNSPRQIGEIFFTRLKLPVLKRTAGGAPSTDEDVLERLALDFPLPKTLLEYRALAKLKSTYTDKLPRMVNPATGRVHTTYGQTTAVTGRLASLEPNLQNIPVRTGEGRRIREAFIAAPGCLLVSADYSQVELRIMAHLSQDAGLLAAFERGEDIHRATAAEVFGRQLGEVTPEERRYAKVINFGLMYGMSAFGLAQQLGLARATADAYIASYFNRYPGVKRYMDKTRSSARERGFVETVFGRRLWLPDIKSGAAARRSAAERAAINAPMQGTAADLIKLATIAVSDWLEREQLGARLIMQVHDELVLEVPQAELERVRAELPRLMSGVANLRVPLEVDLGTGNNWEEAH